MPDATPVPAPDARPCEFCGAPIPRPPGIGPRNRRWARRKFCGQACADGRRRAAASPDRTCRVCKATMSRPPGMAATAWAKRQTCGPDCRRALMRTPFIDPPPAAELRELYDVRRLGADRIGRIYGVSRTPVRRWLAEAGIATRGPGRAI